MSYGPLILTGARALYLAAKGVRNAFQTTDSVNSKLQQAATGAMDAIRRGDAGKLISYANQMISIDSRAPEGFAMRAIGLGMQRNFSAALEAISTARTLDKSNPLYPNGMGVFLVSLNRPTEALRAFEESVKLKPDYMNAHLGKATALNLLGRENDALIILQHYLKYIPLHISALKHMSVSFAQLNRLQEAQQYLERARGLITGGDSDAVRAREVSQYASTAPNLIREELDDIALTLRLYAEMRLVYSIEQVRSVRIGDCFLNVILSSAASDDLKGEVRSALKAVPNYRVLFEADVLAR
jgi:tetratricopeptide (TPR) repeat protein